MQRLVLDPLTRIEKGGGETVNTQKWDTLIIGSGLAGLSCGLELAERGQRVHILEAAPYPGGRTSNWSDTGMEVESGFHKYIGFYQALPDLLRRAGIKLNTMLTWEKTFEIRLPDGETTGEYGIAPLKSPIKTVSGAFGNSDILSAVDKASLMPFVAEGLRLLAEDPMELDTYSVAEFARKHGVKEGALDNILTPLTSGVLFLPPDRYSALVFFGLFAPGLPRFYKLQLGAFNGGMTDVMIAPIVAKLESLGSRVSLNSPVSALSVKEGRVTGVSLADGSTLDADHVVLATEVSAAKHLLQPAFDGEQWLRPLQALPTMPDVTIQLELSEPLLPQDRATFGPGTCIGSFSEQSRTTFRGVPGRVSMILTPPEEFIEMPDELIFERVCEDADKLGLGLRAAATDYRVIRRPDHFYAVQPGSERLRPEQRTPVPGLSLAGDYTRQPMYATMEGAVLSGRKAAEAVLGRELD
ncbi:hydroxysqualene dehydroxylase [Paenibacillus lutrae]|uniref:hydroxysqualene dehydroxylase n=1 Tax=Paenibacillus lutrae TaxID=2078573 RepID=UPI0012FCC2E6|nr:FAD-dependent oxidoreductase [Paenibacillus lutrae]